MTSSGEFGGAEGLLYSVLDELEREWIRVVVVLGPGPVADDIRRRGIPVEVVSAGDRYALLRAVPALRRLMRSHDSRVVHANSLRAAVVSSLATAGTRKRVIWVKVDGTRDGWFARVLAVGCKQVVGISDSVNRTFPRALQGKVHRVYPGLPAHEVDPARARRFVLESLGCPGDSEVVTLAARLCPPKGQLDLLHAAKRLVTARPQVRLAFLGIESTTYPGYGSYLRAEARRLGVGGHVAFLNRGSGELASHENVLDFIAGSDVLAAPSRVEPESGWSEGFGLAPVEAMAMGTPVVAYHHGSFPEVLGDCAVLVAEGDSAALGVAIEQVLSDSELRLRLCECGRERVRTRYRLQDSVRQMKERYAEADAGRRRSPR